MPRISGTHDDIRKGWQEVIRRVSSVRGGASLDGNERIKQTLAVGKGDEALSGGVDHGPGGVCTMVQCLVRWHVYEQEARVPEQRSTGVGGRKGGERGWREGGGGRRLHSGLAGCRTLSPPAEPLFGTTLGCVRGA